MQEAMRPAARHFTSAESLRKARRADRAFLAAVYASSALFVLLVLGLFAVLLSGSWLSLKTFGLAFLWTSDWNPVTNTFGALPLIYGTVVSSAIGLLLAGTVGVFAAAYLADFANRYLAQPLRFMIELLAAVPSVIFGLWGLFVLGPIMR